ncbi:fibronectin type III domain protein, partial [Cooperia oncophora]
SKSPLIQAVKVLVNGSVFFDFLPAEDVDLVSNYTVEYRDVTSGEANWSHFDFESDASSRVLLTSLLPNRTYEARLFMNGHVIHGRRSRTVTFTTNNTGMITVLRLSISDFR